MGVSDVTNLTGSQYETDVFAIFSVCFLSFNFAMVVPILFGNLLILIAMYRHTSLRTIPNIFICSVAVADIMVAVLTIPQYAVVHYSGQNLFMLKYACIFSYAAVMFPCGVSVLSLTAVSIDRVVAISRPFVYERSMTPQVAVVTCVVTWIYTAVMSLAPAMGWNNWSEENRDCALFVIFPFIYSILMLLHVFLGMATTTVAYSIIFWTAWKQKKKIQVQVEAISSVGHNGHRFAKDSKIARMLLTVLGLFYVCWVPFFTLSVSRLFDGKEREPLWLSLAGQTSGALAFWNSAINPVVYYRQNRPFRIAFRQILGRPVSRGYPGVDLPTN